jgi:hypothetical protein
MRKKFEPSSRIPKPGTPEREELDRRFKEAVERNMNTPETVEIMRQVKASQTFTAKDFQWKANTKA